MKQLNKLFFLLIACLVLTNVNAQERYLDEIFSSTSVQVNEVYGQNISVLDPANIGAIPLTMDVYTPDGDDATNRPVVIYFHTGSFLPALFNGQITGAKEDSTCAEICRRLARQGYVAISATYRQGWNPTAVGAEGQNIRTGTLLNAAYRGVQDARAAIRYLRKTVAEDGNPYGIDPERIALWGQGTGGYISYGAAYLNDYSEIVLPKFVDTETGLIFVDSSLSGNVNGTNNRTLNIANWANYSSDFKLAVNAGGALGDTSWVDGTAEEPATIGFHVFADPFAPYVEGPVIVPVTGDFVVNVSGTRSVTERANTLGLNSVFEDANMDLTEPVNAVNQIYKQIPVTALTGQNILLSVDNMYPFVTDTLASGPWEWWGQAQLAATTAGFNQVLGTNFDAVALDSVARILNPDASKMKAMAYIDTMMNYFTPRAYLALNLAEVVNTNNILTSEEVKMTVGPNPVGSETFIQTAADKPMKSVALYHLNGKMLRGVMNVNSSTYTLQRGNLPPGIYVLQAEFEEGIVTQKLVFR